MRGEWGLVRGGVGVGVGVGGEHLWASEGVLIPTGDSSSSRPWLLTSTNRGPTIETAQCRDLGDSYCESRRPNLIFSECM